MFKKIILSFIFIVAHFFSFAQQYNVAGSAYSGGGQGCYILTNTTGQSGAVWNVNTINLTQPFDITIVLNFGVNDADNFPAPTCGADGMTFVLQPNGTGVFGLGGGVGYNGIVPSLGVVMDTYSGNATDPGYDHISIHKNGDVNHGTANELSPFATGTANGFPANIEDGQDHSFRFVWLPGTGGGTMQVYFDNILMQTYTGNIVADIFGGNPVVFWGVSGSTGGCWNVQKVCINISANFTSVGPYCTNQPVQFTNQSFSGAAINSWLWNFGDGTPTVNMQNPTHTYTAAGVYPVTLVITNIAGFTDTITQNVTINHVSVTAQSSPSTICEGFTSTLSATGASVYSWNPGNISGTPVNITPSATTTYTLTGLTSGCEDTATITVTVNPNPQVTTLASPSTICEGTNSSISASSSVANTDFIWYPGGMSGSPVTVTPNATTTYTVTGTAAGCTGTSSVEIIVNQNPAITASATPSTICEGSNSDLAVTSSISGTTFEWMPGNLTPATITVSPSTSTTYTVTGTSLGCTGTATVSITVNPNPIVLLYTTSEFPLCFGNQITVSATGADNYTWSTGAVGSPLVFMPENTLTLSVYGETLNCFDTASLEIPVIICDIVIPNVITPNNDGVNEYFVVDGIENFAESNVQIYNRWGKKIFEQDNYKNDWNAKGMAAGTYFYIVFVKNNTIEKAFHGTLTVLQ